MVITGWSNCSLGRGMVSEFLVGFTEPSGFIMVTLSHLNLFAFYPATPPGLICTESGGVILDDVSIVWQMLTCLRKVIAVGRGREEE